MIARAIATAALLVVVLEAGALSRTAAPGFCPSSAPQVVEAAPR